MFEGTMQTKSNWLYHLQIIPSQPCNTLGLTQSSCCFVFRAWYLICSWSLMLQRVCMPLYYLPLTHRGCSSHYGWYQNGLSPVHQSTLRSLQGQQSQAKPRTKMFLSIRAMRWSLCWEWKLVLQIMHQKRKLSMQGCVTLAGTNQ